MGGRRLRYPVGEALLGKYEREDQTDEEERHEIAEHRREGVLVGRNDRVVQPLRQGFDKRGGQRWLGGRRATPARLSMLATVLDGMPVAFAMALVPCLSTV